jgi:hypothetical protein
MIMNKFYDVTKRTFIWYQVWLGIRSSARTPSLVTGNLGSKIWQKQIFLVTEIYLLCSSWLNCRYFSIIMYTPFLTRPYNYGIGYLFFDYVFLMSVSL